MTRDVDLNSGTPDEKKAVLVRNAIDKNGGSDPTSLIKDEYLRYVPPHNRWAWVRETTHCT